VTDLAVQPKTDPQLAVTLRDYVAPVFRQRKLVTAIFLCIFLGAILSALLLPRKYEAEMKILVNRERVDPVVTSNPESQAGPSVVPVVSEEDLNSEVELLKSRDLLEKVVVACGLAKDTSSGVGVILERLSNALHRAPTSKQTRLAQAVQTLQERLVVDPMKKTTLIRVTYTSRDPQKAAEVLQTLASLYQEKHAAVHRPAGTFKFFNAQADHYRDELAASETALTSFDAKESVVDPAVQKQLVLQQLSTFEAGYHLAQTNSVEAQRRAEALRAHAAVTPERQTTQVVKLDNPQLLSTLEGTLLSLELKRSELIGKYKPDYFPVVQVDAQIADAKRAIEQAQASPAQQITTDRVPAQDWMTTEIARADSDRDALSAQAAATEKVVQRYQAAARDLDAKGIRQQDLARNVKTAEENYLLYVRRREEARISDALDSKRIVNVAVAEAATVPALPTMHLAWIFLGGFLLAGSVSVASAYAVDRFDESFRTPDELLRYLDVKVLASIPSSAEKNA
jgi:uncharacterized protein involved in exopolysaccharide biosynthesis